MKKGKKVRAEKKENNKSLVSYNPQLACLLAEKAEDDLIRREIAGESIDKLCYQITKWNNDTKQKEIVGQDLIYTGYRELARELSVKKQKFLFRFSEPKETYMADLKQWVIRVEATNIETGENAWGGAEVGSEFTTGKPYEFSYRAALTKAQRNALKQLIPTQFKLAVLKKWSRDKNKVAEIPYNRVEALASSEELKNTDYYRKGIHARLSDLKIDPKRWHEFICYDQKVRSFNELPSAILSKLFKELLECKDPKALKEYRELMDWTIETKGLGKERKEG